ncbi:hypothetical protein M0R45_009406 [Rubus argutus]|uniref:Uncharacterized protein n=1 Tax=Rubus argutus TaxID=59490 RepID=A0AAW1Y5R9_RUBAR
MGRSSEGGAGEVWVCAGRDGLREKRWGEHGLRACRGWSERLRPWFDCRESSWELEWQGRKDLDRARARQVQRTDWTEARRGDAVAVMEETPDGLLKRWRRRVDWAFNGERTRCAEAGELNR